MSTLPEELPHDREENTQEENSGEHRQPEMWPLPPLPAEAQPLEVVEPAGSTGCTANEPHIESESTLESPVTGEIEPPRFLFEAEPPPAEPPRVPHLGHLVILGLLALGGLLAAGAAIQVAIHFHLFGVDSTIEAMSEIHYTLGSMAILYLIMLAGCLLSFPPLWHRQFFTGVSWRWATARRWSPLLVGAAFLCFLLALLNGWLMPGPEDAPIDKMFRIPGAAWLLFAFGVTFAPFFEELVFRGFLLPALCTAWDWTAEKLRDKPRSPLAPDGAPRWSLTAMIAGSILTSIPFAGMHAAQTGNSLGPFLLLVCVSLVLCTVRLATHSLAASVLVHASYNFMLFALMLFGTGGFKHLENM